MNRNVFGSLIVTAILLGSCNLPIQTPQAPVSPQVQALRELEQASSIKPEFTFQNGFPLSGMFDVAVEGADPVERARNFLKTYSDLYGQSNPDFGLEVKRINDDHIVFYQTYKGLQVFGGELAVEFIEDRVFFTNGNLLHGDVQIDVSPTITAQDAEAAVILGLTDADVSVQGETILIVYDPSLFGDIPPEPHLAWRVTSNNNLIPAETYVDAHNGRLLFFAPTCI